MLVYRKLKLKPVQQFMCKKKSKHNFQRRIQFPKQNSFTSVVTKTKTKVILQQKPKQLIYNSEKHLISKCRRIRRHSTKTRTKKVFIKVDFLVSSHVQNQKTLSQLEKIQYVNCDHIIPNSKFKIRKYNQIKYGKRITAKLNKSKVITKPSFANRRSVVKREQLKYV